MVVLCRGVPSPPAAAPPCSSAAAARFPNATACKRERDAPVTTAEGGWGGGREAGGEAEARKEKGRWIKKKERGGAEVWGPQVVVGMEMNYRG
jgi:hypothetical protein